MTTYYSVVADTPPANSVEAVERARWTPWIAEGSFVSTDEPRYLMLDVDGVLNSAEYLRERRSVPRPTPHRIDAQTVPRLNEITDRTGAWIVITSTWRVGNPTRVMAEILRMHGVTGRVIDRTPRLFHGSSRGPRGIEIQTWMDAQPEHIVDRQIAILDDQGGMEHLAHRLVQTTWERGLLDEHVERCVEMLGCQ